jgi:hypothetical protein
VYAVFERERGHLSFAGAIAAGFRGRWQNGVTLAPLPPDLGTSPAGPACAERVVGVALDDHSHYRVFTDSGDLEGTGFRSTGLLFGGTFEIFPARSPAEHASMANGPERPLILPSLVDDIRDTKIL